MGVRITARRAVAGAILLLLLAAAAWSALAWRIVAHPTIDAPSEVDAVYILGPVETRIDEALAVMDSGVAPLLLATTSVNQETGEAYATDHCGLMTDTYTVECLTPDPYTTQGEASLLAREAQTGGWDRVAVLTSTPHAARARLLMERCVDAEVLVWDYPQERSTRSWIRAAIYQTGGWVKAQLQRDC